MMARISPTALILAAAFGTFTIAGAGAEAADSGSAVPLPQRGPGSMRAVMPPEPPTPPPVLRANPLPDPNDPGGDDAGPPGSAPPTGDGRDPADERHDQPDDDAGTPERPAAGRLRDARRQAPDPDLPPPERVEQQPAASAPPAAPAAAAAPVTLRPPRAAGSLLDLAPLGVATAAAQAAAPDQVSKREPGEVLFMSPDMPQAVAVGERLAAQGYRLLRRRRLPALELVLSTVRVPEGVAVPAAVSALTAPGEDVLADANHRFVPHAGPATRPWAASMVAWTPQTGRCASGRTIGLIDSVPDLEHPALRGAGVEVHSMITAGTKQAPQDHGTAIAALLVGRQTDAHPPGLLGGAQVLVAGVLRERDDGAVDTTAEWLVSAIDMLLGRGVGTISISLGGPSNRLLEAAVNVVLRRGVTIVAAAGNGGPAGAPVFPAAYPGVIAVTAVDARRELYRNASRGRYVSFAAPGVDLWVAAPGGGGRFVSGTSYAVPFVTALVAAGAQSSADALATSAEDLGEPGRDPLFGWGLIRFPADCATLAAD